MSGREFSGFEVDTVAEAVRQPSLDDLWSNAQARRRRRRSNGVVLLVMVALLSVAAAPLAGALRGTPWASPDDLPAGRERATQLELTGPYSAVGVEMIDHGCTLRFTHTDDGGRSWADWAASRYQSGNCQLDTSGYRSAHLQFTVLGQRSYLVRDGDQLQLSTDYGRTWRDAGQAMVARPTFPSEAQPVYCQQGCGALRQPVAVDPSTGTVYRLTGEPPSPYPPFSIYPSPDGTVWATYWPGDGATVVARTTDRGATWNSWRSAAGANVIAVAGIDDQEAYLLVEPSSPDGVTAASGPAQLLRTTDGGRTWPEVGTDLLTSETTRSFTVASDGSLMVAEVDYTARYASRLLVSRDQGRHFVAGREYSRLDGGVGAAPGQAWLYGRDDMSVSGADHVVITRDGSTWTRFALPD